VLPPPGQTDERVLSRSADVVNPRRRSGGPKRRRGRPLRLSQRPAASNPGFSAARSPGEPLDGRKHRLPEERACPPFGGKLLPGDDKISPSAVSPRLDSPDGRPPGSPDQSGRPALLLERDGPICSSDTGLREKAPSGLLGDGIRQYL
jgi:hypothetical protein